jgi:hypothetical protein
VSLSNATFFNVRVVRLKTIARYATFPAAPPEQRPAIRINEPLNLLAEWQRRARAADIALAGTTQESLVVAQKIDGNFEVPRGRIECALAEFSPRSPRASPQRPPACFPRTCARTSTRPPHFSMTGDANTANVDVVLTLICAAGRCCATVRIFRAIFRGRS